MLLLLAIVLAAALLAYANGANDNFKGVATLFGSASSGYRKALHWACWNTLPGSVAAIWLAHRLTHAFSGKGLVPDSVVAAPPFWPVPAWPPPPRFYWRPAWDCPSRPPTR